MKTTLYATSLLLLIPGVALAAGTDSPWGNLDAALANKSSLSAANGPEMGALLRSSLDFSSDDGFVIGTPPNDEDLRGFRIQDARLWARGTVGQFGWRLSFDFAEANGLPGSGASDGVGTAELQDAYGRWSHSPELNITMGQFLCPPVASSQVSKGNLLFIDRTILGQRFEVWSPGVAVDGDIQDFHYKVAAQNGADDASEDLALTIRGEYAIGGGAKAREGAYGAGEELAGTFGVAYFDEGELDKGSMLTADVDITMGQFSAFGEIADLDDDLAAMMFGTTDGNTPWSLTGSFCFGDQKQYEVGVRYQDLDDTDETTVVGGTFNWYQSGHAAKWQVNVSDYSSDNSAAEGTLFQIGLTLGSDE